MAVDLRHVFTRIGLRSHKGRYQYFIHSGILIHDVAVIDAVTFKLISTALKDLS